MNSRTFFVDENPTDPPRVLLVDDDPVNLLLTGAALRDRGFHITEVASGKEALDLLVHWTPDLVVLDAMMPEMDGFETCRLIRKLRGYASTPVLMLTGLDDDPSIERAYEAGATDFFVKSNQWSLLTGRLRYLLRAARTRNELESSKAKLARAQDLARMGTFEWRRQDGLNFSIEGLRVFGFKSDTSLQVRDIFRMMAQEDRKGFHAILRQVLAQSTVLCMDIPLISQDTQQRIIHIEAEPEFNDKGAVIGYTGIVQNVTDRHIAEDKIKHLSNFDVLTGLPNRRQLMWRTERAIEHAKRLNHQVGLLLIDLDRFKVINDTLGHSAGDELLLEVSRRIRSCVKHSDQVIESSNDIGAARWHRTLEAVGRLGGDEFVALLPEIHHDQTPQEVAQHILNALREPILVGGQECFVSASIGIATFPADGLNVIDLLRNADVAMYTAKSQGPNTTLLYAPHLAGKGRERLELETALHKAIERNELVLHYQPKIDVSTVQVIGVEALMRWQRNGTLVPPNEFIPLAEETGLIIQMSEWAIDEAAKQAQKWRQKIGFETSIAVNLPSRLFEREDLINRIQSALTEYDIHHHALQLEITETGLMKDLQNVIPALSRLTQFGVEISIDDFGTGYSSLSYLTALPISELKIDRSFVRDLGLIPQSVAVVVAILALSRSLGLKVVAEGVEDLRQMQVLHSLGCHLMQGYLFSPALPDEQFQHWLLTIVKPRLAHWIKAAEQLSPNPLLADKPARTHISAEHYLPRN